MVCLAIIDLSLLRADYVAYGSKTEQLERDYQRNLNSSDVLLRLPTNLLPNVILLQVEYA